MSSKTETTATKEDGNPVMVPKLRFPEFLSAEGWKEKPLGTCLDYLQPTPYLVSDTNYSPAFKTPVLTAGKTFILGYTNEEHGIFSDDLPAIIFDDFTTATQFVDFPFKAKSSAMKILLAKNGTDIKFMYATLQTLSYEVGAHERHWISNFAPMLVSVPELPEQQKIAECLSSVDELIAAQARKLDALKTHKKGLMQQLFPREGETQPHLRFPEFREQWVEAQLDNLCISISSGRDQIDSDGAFDLYGSTSVIGKTRNPSFNGERILVARVGANAGMLTRAKGAFGVTDNTLVVSLNPSSNIDFLFHYLGNININRLIFGSGQPLITGSILKNLPIHVPTDSEQQRVADCLTSLDDLIAAQTRKFEALKTHKKGLMQQLFPTPEEVEA